MALVRQNGVADVTNHHHAENVHMTFVYHNHITANHDYDEDDHDYDNYDCDRCETYIQEKRHLESCLTKRRQTIEAEQQKNASLTASLATAQQSLVCCQQEKAALEQRSASYAAVAAQWEAHCNQKVGPLESENVELKRERETLKTKLNMELKISEAKNTEFKALEVEIARLKSERDVSRAKNTELQNERDLLISENSALQIELQIERGPSQPETSSETITENMTSVDLFELENKWFETSGGQNDNESMEAPEWNIDTGLCHH